MGFGVSMKIAPGVRVRASTRGVRASVGPFSASTSRRRPARSTGQRPGGPTRATLAQREREMRAAEREQQIQAVGALERALTTLHLENFPAPERVIVPAPASAPAVERARQAVRLAKRGVKRSDGPARAAARDRALADVDDQLRVEHLGALIAAQREQIESDAEWAALRRHDPATVIDAVDEAFADNASGSTCTDAGTDGHLHYVTCVVVFGPASMVPEQRPATTPTGRPTLRKRNKTERNELYVRALASTVVATAKEALTVAVSADEARVLVLRRDPEAATPDDYLGAIYSGRFDRRSVTGSRDPVDTLLAAPDAMLQRRGATKEVVNLRVHADPELGALLAAFASAWQ